MQTLLGVEGVQLAGIYVCPHGPEDGCACRKPRTALLERAALEKGFDPRRAFVVGDKASDMALGRAMGATTLLVSTHEGASVARGGPLQPDHVVADLVEAAARIERLLAEGEK